MKTTPIAGSLSKLAPLLLSLLLMAAGPLHAEPPADPAGDRASETLDRLRGESAASVRIGIDHATGRLYSLRGRFSAPPGEPEGAARSFLARHADLFGMQPGLEDLALASRLEDSWGTVVRFEQHHQGVPVFGSTVLVGFDAGGAIIHVRSHYVPDLALTTLPKIPESEALQAAEESLGSLFEEIRDDTRLVVVEGGKGWPGHYLAWKVHGFSTDPLGDWHIFVDALGGGVVRSLNLLKTTGPDCIPCDPVADAPNCGSVFFHDPVSAWDNPDLRDTDNVDGVQVPCRLENLTSPSLLDGLYATTQITSPRVAPPYDFLRSVNQQSLDEVITYYHADRAKRYLTDIGFPGVMNFPIEIDAHDSAVGDNSYYDPSAKELHFGEGGVDDGQDPDVVLHEYGHAIQDNQVPGFGATLEGGAMGEGFGDYWAASLLDTQWAAALGPECVAPWDATYYNPYDGSIGSGCLRRLDNSWLYPQDLIYQVHADGEIWSAALWQLRETVGGAIADRLVIKGHTFLTPTSDFLDAADAILSADDALYGGANAAAIHDAMKARGIPRTATPAPSAGMTGSVPFLCESGHRYFNEEYQECVYTQPGASRLRFSFSLLLTEEGYDWVMISDADFNQVERLSGAPFGGGSGFSAAVYGDTIVARFKADNIIRDEGFTIDAVEWAVGAGWIPDGGAVPGSPLTATHGPGGDITLSWDSSCVTGDGDYAVYEGTIGDFTSHAQRFCSTGGLTSVTFTPAGGSAYYLVVPRNDLSEGSYGVRSDDTERPPSTTACLPQEIAGSCS